MEMKRQRKYLECQIAALAVWALSIMLMYATDRMYGKPAYRIALYANAILFWAALLVFLALTVKILSAGRGSRCGRPGIFRFFRNRPAVVCDSALLLLFGGSALYAGVGVKPASQLLSFAQIAGFVFLAGMHGILNGGSYAAAYGEEKGA